MISHSFNIAVPWSLSHYNPLNGFHPLYRALFDHAPEHVTLSAWDNVKLHRRFRSDAKIREALLWKVKAEEHRSNRLANKSVARAYEKYLWPPNKVLTTELMGDIEFHHTLPFPSLTRPFVFHCEAFPPLVLPFVQNGSDTIEYSYEEVRAHLGSILANPLCLGIFSQVPETLESLRRFFSDPIIDRKLFRSRIGLSDATVRNLSHLTKAVLCRPRFLFVNAGAQNSADFFQRGGHIVLRFWKEFLAQGRTGLLMLRCAKPSDEILGEHDVDISMVREQTGRSIIWGQDYLDNHEMNALMASAHFFLLPSASLHSVAIMQAMRLGTIPVVTDTVGASVYVTDNESGIVLRGMYEAIWHRNASTGILVDSYSRTPDLDNSLVSQLISRVGVLLDKPVAYQDMRSRMMVFAQDEFSGQAFSDHFWSTVLDLYHRSQESSARHGVTSVQRRSALLECMVQGDDWRRIFESTTQPALRVNTGLGVVWELGGAMIHTYGNPLIDLHDWSVLAEHYRPGAPRMTFANTLVELGGRYLYSVEHHEVVTLTRTTLIGLVAGVLKRFPRLYRLAAHILSRFRHVIKPGLEKAKADPDVELVRHGICGYNIIRRFDRYFAIRQNEGVFIPAKAESGGYSSCVSGYSLEEVERAIVTAHDFERERSDFYPDPVSASRVPKPIGGSSVDKAGVSRR